MVWLQLQQPTKLEHLATVKLAKWITSHAEELMKPLTDDLADNAEAISQQVEIIRNYLKYLPGTFKNKLLFMLMHQISEVISIFYSSMALDDVFKLQQRKFIADRFLEIFFSNNLTFLSLTYGEIKAFGALFVSRSSMLTGLASVKLDLKLDEQMYMPEYYEDSNYMESCVIEFLKEFRSVQYLTVTSCTNNILCCIAENCTLLEKLHLYNYYTITDDTIDLLARLPILENINLYESPVQLIREADYRMFDSSKRKLLKYLKSRTQFELKSYVNYSATKEELKQVFKEYPLIEKLTFIRTNNNHTLQNYLEVVSYLQNLRELDIHFYDFYRGGVKEVLQLVGSKLQMLKLLGVKQIDMNAVKYISLMCPYLKHLSILDCHLQKENVLGDLFPYNVDFSPFRSLQSLTLVTGLQQPDNVEEESILLFLLSNCLNIEFIDAHGSYLRKDIMLKVLDKNPLYCLKELKWFHKLSKSVIDQITKNCVTPSVMHYDVAKPSDV